MPEPKDYKTVGVKRKTYPWEATERQWSKDMDAYYRLRKQGLQPKAIDGSARLEARANNRLEMDMGHLFQTPSDWAKAKEGMARAEEIKEAIKLAEISGTA